MTTKAQKSLLKARSPRKDAGIGTGKRHRWQIILRIVRVLCLPCCEFAYLRLLLIRGRPHAASSTRQLL